MRAWSAEEAPCSITIASSFLSLSAFGKLKCDSTGFSLNWPSGSLGLPSPELAKREDIEDVCTLVLRPHEEMEIRVMQKLDAREKVIH